MLIHRWLGRHGRDCWTFVRSSRLSAAASGGAGLCLASRPAQRSSYARGGHPSMTVAAQASMAKFVTNEAPGGLKYPYRHSVPVSPSRRHARWRGKRDRRLFRRLYGLPCGGSRWCGSRRRASDQTIAFHCVTPLQADPREVARATRAMRLLNGLRGRHGFGRTSGGSVAQ